MEKRGEESEDAVKKDVQLSGKKEGREEKMAAIKNKRRKGTRASSRTAKKKVPHRANLFLKGEGTTKGGREKATGRREGTREGFQ